MDDDQDAYYSFLLRTVKFTIRDCIDFSNKHPSSRLNFTRESLISLIAMTVIRDPNETNSVIDLLTELFGSDNKWISELRFVQNNFPCSA